ncbi:hypothetical protein V2W45_1453411 [Cenococcum geophilum]
MSQPCIEIALIPIGGRTIEDEFTADGQAWTAIHKNLIEVPGYRGAAWGRQIDALDTLVFLVFWDTYHSHVDFMERINSPFSPALLNMATGPCDMYHIHPSTSSLAFVNAPITTLKFFYQPEATEPLSEKQDVQVWHSVAKRPPLHDSTGFLTNGPGVVAMIGWNSSMYHAAVLLGKDVAAAETKIANSARKTVTFEVNFTVVEKTGYEHSWRKL